MDAHVLEYIPKEDLKLFSQICYIVDRIPNQDFGDLRVKGYKIKNAISCHVLAKALASFFPVEVVSGLIYGHWEHSWLVTKSAFIIDAYPIALFGGPIILDSRVCTPWYRFYETRCSFPEHQSKEFLERVQQVKISIAVLLQKR